MNKGDPLNVWGPSIYFNPHILKVPVAEILRFVSTGFTTVTTVNVGWGGGVLTTAVAMSVSRM